LNEIQKNREDQIRMNDQLEDIRRKYQRAQNSFDKIVDWQSVYDNPPNTLSVYTSRKNIKDQVLFDTWKPLLNDIKSTHEAVNKACKILWNASDSLLEEFGMDVMDIP
jgi:hypothetical protein